MKKLVLLAICIFGPSFSFASDSNVHLEKAHIDVTDFASLQRGARLYMDFCSGCHSLKFARYDGLAKGIGIVDNDGNVLTDLVKETLAYTQDKITAPIDIAMNPLDSAKWFGVAPPDLSLTAKSRGVDWIYSYLKSFYLDETKPTGVNNLVFPDVAMPHVLMDLQGIQVAKKKDLENLTQNEVQLLKQGIYSPEEYNTAVADIVNLLAYVSEPFQDKRKKIGAWVLVFLGILFVFTFLLKREFWKDVH